MNDPAIEVFVNDGEMETVGLIIRSAAIVEYEEELTPGCTLTARHARDLAHALNQCADRIEGRSGCGG